MDIQILKHESYDCLWIHTCSHTIQHASAHLIVCLTWTHLVTKHKAQADVYAAITAIVAQCLMDHCIGHEILCTIETDKLFILTWYLYSKMNCVYHLNTIWIAYKLYLVSMSNTTIIYIKNVYLELNIYQKHGLKVKISTMCDNRDYFIKINYHLSKVWIKQ